jgi:hypothetical protein
MEEKYKICQNSSQFYFIQSLKCNFFFQLYLKFIETSTVITYYHEIIFSQKLSGPFEFLCRFHSKKGKIYYF